MVSDRRFRTAPLSFLLVILITVLALTLAECGDKSSGSALKKVTFTFKPLSHYESVFLAGTFNGWSTDATPMRRVDRGFEVMLLLPAGEYQYKFVADGNWITDEKAERFHPDGYGGRNSVIVVDDSFEAVVLARGDGAIMLDGLSHK
jgi:hypothetical protein